MVNSDQPIKFECVGGPLDGTFISQSLQAFYHPTYEGLRDWIITSFPNRHWAFLFDRNFGMWYRYFKKDGEDFFTFLDSFPTKVSHDKWFRESKE